MQGKRLQLAIQDAFSFHGTAEERGRLAKMDLCLKSQTWRECPEGHEGRLHVAQFCGQRLCPICQKRRAILAKKRYRPAMSEALTGTYTDGRPQVALFVTVTWPSVAHMEKDQVSAMWRDLGKLKRQRWWKDRVNGEVWSLEWTFSPAYGHHSHAHGIVMVDRALYESCVTAYKAAGVSGRDDSARWWADNGPLPKPLLSSAWEKLTGANVVRVDLIKPRRKEWGNQAAMDAALDETLKYPMKETDYLIDRPLRDDERAEIHARAGEILDREEALVELYRAIRGRRLTDVRGCIRGKLLEAMKAVEEATTEELLRMDLDDMIQVGTTCTCCGKEYVEREYVYRHGGYNLVAELPFGSVPLPDVQARRILQAEHDRETVRHLAKSAGRAWKRVLSENQRPKSKLCS